MAASPLLPPGPPHPGRPPSPSRQRDVTATAVFRAEVGPGPCQDREEAADMMPSGRLAGWAATCQEGGGAAPESTGPLTSAAGLGPGHCRHRPHRCLASWAGGVATGPFGEAGLSSRHGRAARETQPGIGARPGAIPGPGHTASSAGRRHCPSPRPDSSCRAPCLPSTGARPVRDHRRPPPLTCS